MSRLPDRVGAVLTALMCLLGLWAFYAQACVLSGCSFATLRVCSFLPLLAAAPLLLGIPRPLRSGNPGRPDAKQARHGWFRRRALSFGAPFAIATLSFAEHSEMLFWVLATCYLTWETWRREEGGSELAGQETTEPRFALIALAVLCTLAAFLTSGVLRPDPDDAYFVNVATVALEFPGVALQSIDGLHRSGLPPVEQALHLPQVYEILIALLSSMSGVSIPVLYYLVLPPLWAVLGTLAHWLALRYFLPAREAILGTAIFVFLLVFWGDGHRVFGNFGFVRLFQGKAILVTVAIPLVVFAALRYRQRPQLSTWLALALCQGAAAGLSTNGLVVAPLASFLVLAARTRFDARFLRTAAVGAAASLPLVVVAAKMYTRMAPYLSVVETDLVRRGYETTLGSARMPLVLLAIIMLPALSAFARLRERDWIAGYVWIIVLLIFLPPASSLAASALGNIYSWRIFWAVPVPFLVCLAGGAALSAVGERRWPAAAAMAVWLAAFALAGPTALSSRNFSLKNLGRLKVKDKWYATAEATLKLARPGAPALVSEPVATYLAGFAHAPPLVGVRRLYLRKLKGVVPGEELALRMALFNYVSSNRPAMSLADALKAIDAQDVATVVFSARHRDERALAVALVERGFTLSAVRGSVIATRPK